jgi:ParB family chromosome partitioning protein
MATQTAPGVTPPARKRLGRGLGALISSAVHVDVPARRAAPQDQHKAESTAAGRAVIEPKPAQADAHSSENVRMLPLDAITSNRRQPRQKFDERALDELAQSIRTAGLMQPILVRPEAGGVFELIAGERRWRAAKRVPLAAIPAIVRDVDDRTAAEWALIENIQREDLNPIDRAEAFHVLVSRDGLTHQDLAERLGIDRSTVTNLLRLKDLDNVCRSLIREGALGLGHAKALLGVSEATRRQSLAAAAVRGAWSVRELERRARAAAGGGVPPRGSEPKTGRRAHLDDLEQRLGRHLGTRVRIHAGRKKGQGQLVLDFFSLDEFDELMRRLGFHEEAGM